MWVFVRACVRTLSLSLRMLDTRVSFSVFWWICLLRICVMHVFCVFLCYVCVLRICLLQIFSMYLIVMHVSCAFLCYACVCYARPFPTFLIAKRHAQCWSIKTRSPRGNIVRWTTSHAISYRDFSRHYAKTTPTWRLATKHWPSVNKPRIWWRCGFYLQRPHIPKK